MADASGAPRWPEAVGAVEAGCRRVVEQNRALMARARDVDAAVSRAPERCHRAASEMEHLRGQLEVLPACAAEVRGMVETTVGACAQLEFLERQLTEIAVVRVHLDEARRRERETLARHEVRAAAEAAEQQREADSLAERRAEFGRAFDADREYMRRHGAHGLRPPAQPGAVDVAATLADVAPEALVAPSELDAFYDEGDGT